ncbi:hypothetical protein HDV57DRAFT_136720 [Trichoderma longibrachiatum]|uniref:Uncharacterized protein n=1 Tax=Trichoderma longibrachiatum ATCC 18648 TaxID=983965 RepID=A0A2T4BVD0_TRILO|nr:hypothetical protein M440DRAFT_1076771 [Trichoderma longibrachiatum ATCC 18648]
MLARPSPHRPGGCAALPLPSSIHLSNSTSHFAPAPDPDRWTPRSPSCSVGQTSRDAVALILAHSSGARWSKLTAVAVFHSELLFIGLRSSLARRFAAPLIGSLPYCENSSPVEHCLAGFPEASRESLAPLIDWETRSAQSTRLFRLESFLLAEEALMPILSSSNQDCWYRPEAGPCHIAKTWSDRSNLFHRSPCRF